MMAADSNDIQDKYCPLKDLQSEGIYHPKTPTKTVSFSSGLNGMKLDSERSGKKRSSDSQHMDLRESPRKRKGPGGR